MLDPKEGLTPEDGTEPKGSEEPQEPEVKPEIGEDIEPPVRKPSEIDKYQEQIKQEKWKNKVEFDLRKMREENQRLRSELGQEPLAKTTQTTDLDTPVNDSSSKDQFLSDLEKREREREVKDFVKDNAEYKGIEKTLTKFVNHSAYSNVPVDFIAKALSSEKAQRVGAQKALEAQKDANMSKTGGHPFTPKEGKEKNWADPNEVSNEEFEKELAKVKRQ